MAHCLGRHPKFRRKTSINYLGSIKIIGTREEGGSNKGDFEQIKFMKGRGLRIFRK